MIGRLDRGRAVVLVVALVGVGLIVAGWLGGGGWQSVAIEVGAALALVVVILAVEDAWRREVDRRIDAVAQEVAEVRAATSDLAEAQAQRVVSRRAGDSDLVAAWVADPRPETLWAIAERCKQLGLSLARQTTVGNAVVVISPVDVQTIELTVVPGSSKFGTGRRRWKWTADVTVADTISRIDGALAELGVHPGPDAFDFAVVISDIAGQYARDIAGRFGEPAQH